MNLPEACVMPIDSHAKHKSIKPPVAYQPGAHDPRRRAEGRRVKAWRGEEG